MIDNWASRSSEHAEWVEGRKEGRRLKPGKGHLVDNYSVL